MGKGGRAYEYFDTLPPDHELLIALFALEDGFEDVHGRAEERAEDVGRCEVECRGDCVLELDGAFFLVGTSECGHVDDVCVFLMAGWRQT